MHNLVTPLVKPFTMETDSTLVIISKVREKLSAYIAKHNTDAQL